MKRFLVIVGLCVSLLASTPVHAQYGGSRSGRAAQSGMTQASSDWAVWGLGLAGLAFLATMSGIIAASATDSPTTFSH